MKSKTWVLRHKNDQFVKRAKQLGYINRAAFKLEEIEKKYGIIKKSKDILELGSSPGGWTQFIINSNISSNITCFDLLDMKTIKMNSQHTVPFTWPPRNLRDVITRTLCLWVGGVLPEPRLSGS